MSAADFANWLSTRDIDKSLFPYFPDSDRQKLDARLLGLFRAAEGLTPAAQLRHDADVILTDVTVDPSDDPSNPKKPYLIKPGGRLSPGPLLSRKGLWLRLNLPLLEKDERLKEEVSALDSALSAVADLAVGRGKPTSVDIRDLADALRHYLEVRGLEVVPTTSPTARMLIDLDRRQVTLDGKTYDVRSEQALRWLQVLSVRPGLWVRSRDLAAKDPELTGARTDRLKPQLPEEIQTLIDSEPGLGSRIRLGHADPPLPKRKRRRRPDKQRH